MHETVSLLLKAGTELYYNISTQYVCHAILSGWN